MTVVLWADNEDYSIPIECFIKKYNPVFGTNLTFELLVEMALHCFIEDVKEGRMDIIGLADTFGFGDEQLKVTPTEDELNRKLQAINEGGL